jgi:hypothetical protein
MPSCPEKRKEQRRIRNEARKARMAVDPEYAARQKEIDKAAKKKYEAKKRFDRENSGPVGSGKPGRIVALCGWMNW